MKKIIKNSRTYHSKKYAPSYICINGHTYEKISSNAVNVELDLAEDVLSYIDLLIHRGEFVSRGDAIRTILRNKLNTIKDD